METRDLSQGGLEDLHESPGRVDHSALGRLANIVRPGRMWIPSVDASVRWLGGLFGLVRTRLHSPFTHEEVGSLEESSRNGTDKNNVEVHPDPAPLLEEFVPEQVTERQSLECVAPLGLVTAGVVELLAPVDYHVGVNHRDIRSDGDGHLLSHGRDTVMSEEIDSSAESSPRLETEKLKQ